MKNRISLVSGLAVIAIVLVAQTMMAQGSEQILYLPAIARSPLVSPLGTGDSTIPPSAPNWQDYSGMDEDLGMSPTTFAKLNADAASGQFDWPCTIIEHDPLKWHSLLNYVDDDQPAGPCHFDHMHLDDPHAVSDLFGEPGAWFEQPGQSISYPWQTFPANQTDESPDMYAGRLENQVKHEGYLWIVRRNQPCSTDGYCVTDFRVQFHQHGPGDAHVRFHSAQVEARVCGDATNPATCGIIRTGGWMDHAFLIVPKSNESCFMARNSGFNQAYVPLTQQDQRYFEITDAPPFDEFRCHVSLTSQQIADGPIAGKEGPVEWWAHGASDWRFQSAILNPIANVNRDQTFTLYCPDPTQPGCKWNATMGTLRLQYTLGINSYFFDKADVSTDRRVVNLPRGRTFITRLGALNANCTLETIGVDCIPIEYSNLWLKVGLGQGQNGYQHNACTHCLKLDHDLTPDALPSWVTWFYRYLPTPNVGVDMHHP